MVNSGSLGSERNGNTNASCMQTNGLYIKTSSSPLTASSAIQSKKDFTEGVGTRQPCGVQAVVPIPSKKGFNDHNEKNGHYSSAHSVNKLQQTKTLFCSFPLEKVQRILSTFGTDDNKMKVIRKVLCLYCDRTFVNVNLRQKHVERCHSSKQLRRVSLRKQQNVLTCTPCIYCDKFTSAEHTLKDLFKHMIENHANKYFGCLSCEMRFLNFSHLTDHNALYHEVVPVTQEVSSDCQHLLDSFYTPSCPEKEENQQEITAKTTRTKQKVNKCKLINGNIKNTGSNIEVSSKTCNIKNLRTKKLSVKTSRMILKRSKRLQAKLNTTSNKKRTRDYNEKKKDDRVEQTITAKLNERSTKSTSNFVNPYPEFDHFFQVKKITDHSIDNLKISSLTFDDVFDKAFFNRIKCNIQENLLHHIDGKLFKNEESENRISNFEKISNIPQEPQHLNTDLYGCELSLNAVAPTTLLLSNQLGDDPESQIEYGSKPSKKKSQMKNDEVHYKYFTRRKYQASILEHKENRDLSKLDMWTQYVIKNRQQKILDDKKSPKEILDYFAGEEYKNMMKREELNRILDRRGPFEDLREEVSKRAALDKLYGEDNSLNEDHFTEIGDLLNDILNRVFDLAKESYPSVQTLSKNINQFDEDVVPAIPSYLNLRPSTDVIPEDEIDKSDRIALICSSQETENFELPGNTVRGKNEKVELTGEWARSRIYVCAACGLKLQNIKQFLEHKSTSHQYIWVQHYEFVGNQSELYTHLSIPALGKVGVLENIVQCKLWRRSDSRSCTKCDKQCNSLGELHRHILECGGDWTWMLARKKCKYRPFGAKSRRKRRGLVKRIYAQKAETEKKMYKKTYLPKQKPSDADTIKRMLANLPPKRATRKIICLKDGFNTSRSKQRKTTKQSKFNCGKLIRGTPKEQKQSVNKEYEKTDKTKTNNYRRSLRCLNKVLTSRILDTNASLIVKRKYSRQIKNKQRKNSAVSKVNKDVTTSVHENYMFKSSLKKVAKANNGDKSPHNDRHIKEVLKFKRSSPRIEKRLEYSSGVEKINIKHFFPIKKKKKKVTNIENVNHRIKLISSSENEENCDFKERNKLIDNADKSAKSESGRLNNINLRKRKIEKHEPSIPKLKKNNTSSYNNKKRKLRNNLVSTVSETTLQLDTPECVGNDKSNGLFEIKDFFERCQTMEESDKSTLNTAESVSVGIPQETQSTCIGSEQLDTDKNKCSNESTVQNIIILERKTENVEELKSDLLHSLKSNKKVRKPVRGLNDCIAMLTSKLVKNFEESATQSIFGKEVSTQTGLETSQTCQRSEYILKIPFFNEHFQLCTNEKQNVYSDTNTVEHSKCKSLTENETTVAPQFCLPNEPSALNSNEYQLNDSEFSEIDKYPTSKKKNENNITIEEKYTDENSRRVCKDFTCGLQNNFISTSEITSNSDITLEECKKTLGNAVSKEKDSKHFDQILTCEEERTMKEVLRTKNTNDTDSEDEMPLSSLLKDEQRAQNMPSVTNTNEKNMNELNAVYEDVLKSNEEEQLVSKIASSEKTNRDCDNPDIPQIDTNNVFTEYKGAPAKNIGQIEEYLITVDEDVNLSKKKDISVLCEISDNLCEYSVSANVSTKPHFENNKFGHKVSHEVTGNELFIIPDISLQNRDDNTFKTNFVEGAEDIDNFTSLDANNCDYHVQSEKFYIKKNNVDVVTTRDTILSDVLADEPLNINRNGEKSASEYKENSILLIEEIEGKRKPRKKSLCTSKVLTKKSEILGDYHIRESIEPQTIVDIKKTFQNAKSNPLDSIIDDVALQLAKNEFCTESSLKSLPEISNLNFNLSEKKDTATNSPTKATKSVTCESEENPIKADTFTADTAIVNNGQGCLKELTEDRIPKEAAEVCGQRVKTSEDLKKNDDSVKELRRSARNSKRVTNYNETDTIDPVFDDSDRTISKIIKETSKETFGFKRKNRKSLSQKKLTKNDEDETRLSGEELFDTSKTTSNESTKLSKPTNTCFNTFDKICNDLSGETFAGERRPEKSIPFDENFSKKVVLPYNKMVEDKLNSVNDNCSNSNTKTLQKKISKCKSKNHKSKNRSKIEVNTDFSNTYEISGVHQKEPEPASSPRAVRCDVYSKDVTSDDDKNKVYCDICNKKFCRMENLSKHKRTLTHISKLSHLDATWATSKSKSDLLNTKEETETAHILSNSISDVNLMDVQENTNEEESEHSSPPCTVNDKNSNLKLTGIINDIFNKSMLNKDEEDSTIFPETMIHSENETQPEIGRCKNLAERKSFESENCFATIERESHNLKNVDYFKPEISTAAAGTIVETQITLLQNIIESSKLGYKEELSGSLSPNVHKIHTLSKTINSVSQKFSEEDTLKWRNIEESSLKLSQCEDIAENSDLRNYDEQKSRKVLNRDEELFLECCSLLKSGPEVPGYSKNSEIMLNDLNNLEIKPCGDRNCSENKCLSQSRNREFVECHSGSLRITTPLEDGFTQEQSNSATISSQWEMNNFCIISNKELWKEDLNIQDQNFIFEEVFSDSTNEVALYKENRIEELQTIVSSFDQVITQVLNSELNATNGENVKQSLVTDSRFTSDYENKACKNSVIIDGKKVLTKGAMKVFEGLRVSIPTEELNMNKILTSASGKKTPSISATDVKDLIKEDEENRSNTTQSIQRINQSESIVQAKTEHILKVSSLNKQNNLDINSKAHDVYDFEETQDNSDDFTKPDFRSFRTSYEKSKKFEKPEGSDDDSRDCTDAFGCDALSSSTSSISEVLPVKSTIQENITKKKCMIMGRIFKNAVKSRFVDEDIRNIPVSDNTKLVEDFVLSCAEPMNAEDKKPRMTEHELNLAFDKLINNQPFESKQTASKTSLSSQSHQKNSAKRKQKARNKKRSYSDSSDDEFKLQVYSKKRHKKKNNNSEENCINLEQELRECIGVASRKSQRKCTSGKQNVLMEYWSSDESSFESIIENQITKSLQTNCNQSNRVNENSIQDWHYNEAETNSDTPANKEKMNQTLDTEFLHKRTKITQPTCSVNRRKRVAANPLYHWPSSSEDESRDLIEIRPMRDEFEDDEDRPVQHGWIVGDSPKKLVTMLAQAKGKKCDIDSVKEHSKKRTSTLS